MRQAQTVIFDNEAVQALAEVTHRKHRRLLAIVEAADRAARVRVALASTVADAHIASTLETTSGPHAVLTGDPEDIRRIAQTRRCTAEHRDRLPTLEREVTSLSQLLRCIAGVKNSIPPSAGCSAAGIRTEPSDC